MKGIYKAIIGIATTGAVATAGIVTANMLSENKGNEETKPVAIVNEMGNTVNKENKIEENIVDNSTENNIQDNNINKNDTNNVITKPDTTVDNNQPEIEEPQETVKNDDENKVQNSPIKRGIVEVHVESILGDNAGVAGVIIKVDNMAVYSGGSDKMCIAPVAGSGKSNVEVDIETSSTILHLTGIIDFNDENPRCIFK